VYVAGSGKMLKVQVLKMQGRFACAVLLAASGAALYAQTPAPVEATPAPAAVTTPAADATPAPLAAQTPAATQGGMIHGIVVAGTAGKPGGIPLPGVAITATNSLSGKKYNTTTDVTGEYAMVIPKNGRYVVKVELAAFAAQTVEVLLTTDAATGGKPDQKADFGMQLASRVAAAEARQTATAANPTRGIQSLNVNAGGDADTENASLGGAANDTSLPSLGGIADNSGAANDSYAVSGTQGQTNNLGGMNEDEIRQRVEDAVAQNRLNGGGQGGDPTGAILSVLGPMMGNFGGGGGPGGGGPGGGGRGGRGGGGGGGNFRNFNPAQPHGAINWTGGNSALNATQWQASNPTAPHFVLNPAAYSNNFGLTVGGSPYIPGLTKPNTKQFVFLSVTGHKNLNAFAPDAVRVPTAAERNGDFSKSANEVGGTAVPVTLYDPTSGAPITGNNLANASIPISPVAKALLNFYPAPNIATSDPTANNYQTISNAGNNSLAINTRYNRTLGSAPTPFGGGRGGGGGGGRRGGGNANANTKPTLRQSINLAYNYSHTAADQRNIFLPLGGATETDGNGLNAGYTVGYGRISNNFTLGWNRSNAATRNYFTNTANNPSAIVGLEVPNNTGGFANPGFYNGLPSFSISNFAGLSNTTPSETINQTISFSDFVSWRHGKHNYRFGLDVRRVHADSIGGNNPLGSFSFTGYATANPADQVNNLAGQASGSAFADFLLGLPQTTGLQAGLYKTYLRENVYDAYVQDDFRVLANVTLNYGLRYEYFGPYTEKNDRLVNLTGVSTLTGASSPTASVGCVTPTGLTAGALTCAKGSNASLVNPDHTMFAPRLGIAWRPKLKVAAIKDVVIRTGYGMNYNTGQYATFARSLSHQVPFANTQTNTVTTPTALAPNPTATGCTTTQAPYVFVGKDGQSHTRLASQANLTLDTNAATNTTPKTAPFSCATAQLITNNWAVDPNYRLGMVQIYNVNVQKTIPLNIVLNIGYNGAMGSNLDIVGSPNATPTSGGSTIHAVAPFDFERSIGSSRSNSLVISAQKRQVKGIALGATYTYGHTITNASGVGGAVGTPIQDYFHPELEYGNASFDQRHNLTGNWVTELPFGPNRAFLNKGGVMAKILDGYSLSGTFTFGSGHYYTPQYSGVQTEAQSGNVFHLRPDRVTTQSTKGPGMLANFFNKAAFVPPAGGSGYGTASPGSIEGPGTVAVSASLSRTIQFEGTNSFEARVTATNVFNTVQYSGINTTENAANFGHVTSAAGPRVLQLQARYRF